VSADKSPAPATSERVHAFKLDQRGLARVFGELEAPLMEAVWALGEASVADVCRRLGEGAHYKTVTTVMNRLVDKRLLVRRRDSRAFVYAPVESRAAFEAHLSRRVAEGLVRDFGDLALAQFVDALSEVDPRLLARLEALVRARSEAEVEGPTEAAVEGSIEAAVEGSIEEKAQ